MKIQPRLPSRHPLFANLTEFCIVQIFDIEVSIGLVWFPSVRDDFRHMWE